MFLLIVELYNPLSKTIIYIINDKFFITTDVLSFRGRSKKFITKLLLCGWFYQNTPKVLGQFFNVMESTRVSTLLEFTLHILLVKVIWTLSRTGFGYVESYISLSGPYTETEPPFFLLGCKTEIPRDVFSDQRQSGVKSKSYVYLDCTVSNLRTSVDSYRLSPTVGRR